ncbi:hypothetical protein [Candidatus Lokiarchaeum ossiferum]
MSYPKEKIAKENEQKMYAWLRKNESKLPLTLYGICKELQWTFGATRGTLLRIEKKNPRFLIKKEIIDPQNKRFKTKIALRNSRSEQKLMDEFNAFPEFQNQSDYDLPGIKEMVNKYLKRLTLLDDKVMELIQTITHTKTLENIVELEFGLSEEERKELDQLIQELAD